MNQSETVRLFQFVLRDLTGGAFFTNQGYDLCGPVVVLADLVDFSAGIAPAGKEGAAGQGEEVANMPHVGLAFF